MTENIPKMFVFSSVLHPPFQNDNHMLVPILVDLHIKTIGVFVLRDIGHISPVMIQSVYWGL